MPLKLINAIDAKPGVTILIDGEAFLVRINDISKSGKHGASKCRIGAISIIDGRKKVMAVPGHERFEVPSIERKRAQVLSVAGGTANVMDLENFETFDIPVAEELRGQIKGGDQVEYSIIEEKQKIIRRKL